MLEQIREHFLYEHTIAMIDFGTLAILFCLMTVVAGFGALGYMDALAQRLCQGAKNFRSLMLALVLVPFFLSMLVTNDVALIIMVPFAIQVLHSIGKSSHLIKVVVLQTIGANLGSMLTPIGNPQNVFIYQKYKMNPGMFFQAIAPYAIASFLILVLIISLDRGRDAEVCLKGEQGHLLERNLSKKRKTIETILYTVLFLVCLLTVLDVIAFGVMLICVIFGILCCNYRLFRQVDYGLLFKFVVLFLIVGNLGEIPWIHEKLKSFVAGNEFAVGIGLSQCLSNVPTAIMLSNFTTNGVELMLGVNVGGLGTMIASMASMISMEFYKKSKGAKKGQYVKTFLLYNVGFLVVLCMIRIVVEMI